MAGLESDLGLLKKYFKPSMSVAVCGIMVPVALVYILGRFFDFNNEQAIFLGVTFAATSVSISVEVLKELRRLDSPHQSWGHPLEDHIDPYKIQDFG